LGFSRLVHRVLGLAPSKVTGIAAVVGPSTPGGIRLSVTVANALAWALNLPVAAYELAEGFKVVHFGRWQAAGTLRPRYIHAPNITKPK
jgi:tRNA A37 threonylcarbamoyladenosine modification protein TsaB